MINSNKFIISLIIITSLIFNIGFLYTVYFYKDFHWIFIILLLFGNFVIMNVAYQYEKYSY